MKKRLLTTMLSVLCAVVAVMAQKFVILSDIHVDPGNKNEKMLRETVTEINGIKADAVLMTGDLTDEGSDEELENVKSILDQINKPLYVIPGNHEVTWSQSNCKKFTDLWGNDRFVFETGNLIVIAMNCGPFMKMGDGHIKQEDLIWLDKTLSERVKPGKRVLSINHYPLLDDLDNYQAYVKILQKYPVITHQCGHYHRWSKYETGGIDGVMVRSLDLGNNNYGYTLLDVTPDSVKFYEKELGKAPVVKYAYKINTSFKPLPEVKLDTEQPAGFEVKRVFADVASVFTRVGVDKDNLYFGNSLGYLKVIDKKTGKEKWEYSTQGMLFSRPVVTKKWVILPTSDKRLVWLDKATGKEACERAAKGPYAADGLVKDGILYQGGYKTMQAWNVDKKQLVWEYDSLFNYCQAQMAIDGNDLVFGAWDTNLRGLTRKTGKLDWVWNNGQARVHFSPGNVIPAICGDKVITVAPDRYMTCIDRKTGKQLWRWHEDKFRVRESMGVSADKKVVYAKTMDGILIAVDATANEFKMLWHVDLGFGYDHAPCGVVESNGLIYCGSRHGDLACVDAKTHKLLFKFKAGTSEVNGFEVDEKGDVYCSMVEGTIWKISRKK